jgi:hypothetical protein
MERAAILVDAGPAPARRAQRAPAPPQAGALALQRQIGNRALGRLLQRDATAEVEVDARWHITPASVADTDADALTTKAEHAVVFWVNYDNKNKNNAEFENAATDFAKTYGTLGMTSSAKAGGHLKFGVPIEVGSRDDVTQAITAIHQAMHELWWERYHDSDEPLPDPKIGTVAIFAHGERDGIGIDHANSAYTKKKHLPAWIGAMRPALASDVKFLLYACSSGAAVGEKIDQTAMDSGLGGKGSFAQELASALGGSAEVYAHEVAGNVASNPFARRFTAGEDEGESMFDVLYGDDFVDDEGNRLRDEKADLVAKYDDDELATKLKGAMWRHYVDAVSSDFVRINSHSRHFKVGGYTGVGGAMFMDADSTADLLRADFSTYWLDDATIRNDFTRPAPPPKKKK